MNEILWKTRWSSEQIKAMLIEQAEVFWDRETGIERSELKRVKTAARTPYAVIISGLRRVGKSTLLAQLAHQIGRDAFFYLNFEDERFIGFQADDAGDLYRRLVEIFGDRKIFLIDEIQNIPGWEHFVRRFMDMGYKFYITGSNASLLSRDLGTRLTGRYIPVELFPFSFNEYLTFRAEKIPNFQRMTTVEQARMNALLNDYLLSGGIPDALKYPELPILRTLYDDVLYRDIATRHKLEATQALKELSYFMISNPAGLVNFNKLKERFNLGSVNTVKSYIEYMQNSWLLFTMNLYAFSLKRQQIAPKKVYCIDTGLVNDVGFQFSPNSGKLIENIVFLALRQKQTEVYYYVTEKKHGVDFYLPKTRQLIQVSKDMSSASTREREIRSLVEAAKEIELDEALILSDVNEDNINIDNLSIKVQALPEWLLGQER